MAKLTLQVRTENNLLELLAKCESPRWVVAKDKVDQITHVHVVNFDGTQMIEGIFDRNGSHWDMEMPNRLVVRFFDGKIINCEVDFKGRQNPVYYPELCE